MNSDGGPFISYGGRMSDAYIGDGDVDRPAQTSHFAWIFCTQVQMELTFELKAQDL
jgi:hypothetical protein